MSTDQAVTLSNLSDGDQDVSLKRNWLDAFHGLNHPEFVRQAE